MEDNGLKHNLEWSVCAAVMATLERYINSGSILSKEEAVRICKQYGVNHRFDAKRCGQDFCGDRLNLFTNKNGNVKRLDIG